MRWEADIGLFFLFIVPIETFSAYGVGECGEPAPVPNAYRTISNTTVQYRCIDNYVLTSGNLTRTCVNGVLTGSPPICSLECGPPLSTGNAAITHSGTLGGSVVTYTCGAGSLENTSTTECDESIGYWRQGDQCFDSTPLDNSKFSATHSSTGTADVVFSNAGSHLGNWVSLDASNAIDANTGTSLESGDCSSTGLHERPRLFVNFDDYYSISQVVFTIPNDTFAQTVPYISIRTQYTWCSSVSSGTITPGSSIIAKCTHYRYTGWGRYLYLETYYGKGKTGMLQICNVEIYARPTVLVDCGRPFEHPYTVMLNHPSDTHYKSYDPDVVFYSCIEGYTPKSGRNYSYCNGDGKWTSSLVCTAEENQSAGTNVSLSDDALMILPPLTDSNISTCITVPNVKEATFTVELMDDTEVTDISVTLNDVSRLRSARISITVYTDSSKKKSCELYTLSQSHIYKETCNVICQYNPVGRYVDVRVYYSTEASLEICEIMVHGRKYNETLECYQNKQGYKGRMNMTMTGTPCQRWDSQTPHAHSNNDVSKFPDVSLTDAANYCRNPDDKAGPWCYTTDSDVQWEYCPVRSCDKMCLRDANVHTYSGYTPNTVSGDTCVNWYSDTIPFKRSSHFIYRSYCSNPLRSQSEPWCYTDTNATQYEHCSIPTCPTSTELTWGHWVMDVGQTLGDLPSQECLVWKWIATTGTFSTYWMPNPYRFYLNHPTHDQVCPFGKVFNATVLCYDVTATGILWKTGIMECIHCGTPPPANFTTVFTSSGHLNGIANYTCIPGYARTSGSETISCLKTGLWEIPDIYCEVDCGTPPYLNNSIVMVVNTTVNSTANYACDADYAYLTGSISITCNETGHWGMPTIQCIVDCGTPPSLNNTHVVTVNTTLNSTAMYTCDPGYVHVTGSTNVTCTETGEWEIPTIKCFVDCGQPPEVLNTNKTMNSTLENSTTTYTCIDDYAHVSGSDQISCLHNGSWERVTMSCLVDCGEPPQMPHTSHTTSGTWLGNMVQYRCDDGFASESGSAGITCLQNGSWERPSIVCDAIPTTTVVPMRNVTDKYGRYRYESCICRCVPKPRTQEDIIKDISSKLQINTKALVSYISKKKSRPDERESSEGMAFLGVTLIAVVFGSLFVSDIYYGFAAVKKCFQSKPTVSTN